MTTEPLNFDQNGLYMLFSDLGDGYRFHWQLYLATSPDFGTIFHLNNPEGNGTTWIFEVKPNSHERDIPNLVLATKIANMEPILYEALKCRLEQLPIEYSSRFRENITCRVWVKEALFALDDEGYIQLLNGAERLEKEVTTTAMMNRFHRRRTVTKSSWGSS